MNLIHSSGINLKSDNGLAEPKPQFGCCPDLVCSTTERWRQTPVQYGLVWRSGPLLLIDGWETEEGDGEIAPTAPVSGHCGLVGRVRLGAFVIR